MIVTGNDAEWSPKYYAVVTGLFCGLYMASVATAGKIIMVYGLTLPAAIIVFPICCILTDILTEVYGFNRARKALWTTLACTVLFTIVVQGAAMLPPAPFWDGQDAFAKTFATTWRIALAGIVAWVGGEFINSLIVSKMKIAQQAKGMSGRFILSTVVGQCIDSFLFIVVAFGGVMTIPQMFAMFLTGWGVKVAYEIIALPISIPVTNHIKRIEGVEHFDRQKISII